MYEIQQVDSLLEASQTNSNAKHQIKKLYDENLNLREELRKINEKIDQALESLPKPRTSSEPRRYSRKETRQSSNPPLKSTQHLITLAFSNPLLKSLESRVAKLEQENFKLKSKLDKNHIYNLDKQVQPLFQRFQKFLKLIYKADCVLVKTNREIRENSVRIVNLQDELAALEPQTPSFGKTGFSPRFTSPNVKMQRLYEKEKKLLDELALAKEVFGSKEKQLRSMVEEQQKYFEEIKKLEKMKSEEKLPFRQIFSPKNIKIISEKNGLASADRRARQRSNTGSNKNIEFTGTGRFSGSLEPLSRQSSEKLLNTQVKIDEGVRNRISRIFKNVNLKPEEFEFTHNFSKAIANLNK